MLKPRRGLLAMLASAALLSACQSVDTDSASSAQVSQPPAESSASIKVNQVGFTPTATKMAVVPSNSADRFSLIPEGTNTAVYSGRLSASSTWDHSGETVKIADFSDFSRTGEYRIRVEGLPDSHPFSIAPDVYVDVNDASLKAFYFNRASTELLEEHAGIYARPAGHPDDQVKVHSSAASRHRPEGTIISGPKGWYDAGDYNKYIVNSGITTYTLLAAYEHFPEYYAERELNIPESGNGVPDLLDEIMWNLEWMLTMQDPNDGGVYHKLTTKRFEGRLMPHEATNQRYVVKKGTAAALNFAAVMAVASRVYADYEEDFPGFSTQALEAAEAAWQWAQANPDVTYRNPEDIHTGQYGDQTLFDEFGWAAAELYITTGQDRYYEAIMADELANVVPNWAESRGLAWMSLAHHRDNLTPIADQRLIAKRIDELAQELHAEWQESAYRVPMRRSDFVWGSNAVAMNNAMMLLQGYRLKGDGEYLEAAQSLLDYVLGRNATGYSFVTGHGSKTPMHIHHRPSDADGIEEPIPGFIAGGPQPGQQDGENCEEDGASYPSDKPAKSYVDHWCSYASNEIAINWNAPLVYVSGAIQALRQTD
ncbi:glycoside hydrolase family 9 protein [Marinimicrobium sp. ABcell2]|uniref:glycoside hydrolase family 9 protein n=1 Tax=Marinimicrobium sp. ABcell2 TaxID=3069751 RepID=UPI0027B0F98F|nr:glycoside hydrolase family 9 protein [Marinimicrobium sp. ABcell2]MDQ2078496.1 glycoside hydrolase family 9 protein [Marinimicrobium sp. ABcell2]